MKIPSFIINDLESETYGLSHGTVTLQLSLRDSHLSHYKINREKSIVTLTKAEGDRDTAMNYGADQNKMRGRARK